MAADPIETLKQARESFVRKRRSMAEQMVPTGAAASHFAPNFSDIQAAIEAIDRAIEDEGRLPEGYAAAEPASGPGPELATLDGTNVTDVDFDPA